MEFFNQISAYEKMKNQRDDNGERHGLWEQYYPNGKLWYRENYKNGKLHGPCEIYYDNGEVRYNGNLNREKPAGLWYELYQ